MIFLGGCSIEEVPTAQPPSLPSSESDSNRYFDSLASLGLGYGFQTIVPRRDFDIVLSAPTQSTMTVTLLTYHDCVGYLSYNSTTTPLMVFKSGIPLKIVLSGLLPSRSYNYQFHYRKEGESLYSHSSTYSFAMPKEKGEAFSFAITADSHLDENCDTATYQSTLRNILGGGNDFLVDLGDTFMTDKYGLQYSFSHGQFLAQRYYLGGVCSYLPLFFVQGNHDGETGLKKSEMTDWTKRIRESYFPNPLSENYFSWNWGDVLVIVLDPFTFTTQQGSKDPWQRTLGEIQYRWLESTLKNSTQKYKLVFIHNLVGGVDVEGQARGGAEVASYWEWGGRNLSSVDVFSLRRNGWGEPIHSLLKRYGVGVVFHGHDHVYARQEYDGIVYQCVPQPGIKRYDRVTYANDYGYKEGVIRYDPGYIRVSVLLNSLKIDYVAHTNTILYSYTL